MGKYTPNGENERREMLEVIGAGALEELFSDIPSQVRAGELEGLPEGASELEVMRRMKRQRIKTEFFRLFSEARALTATTYRLW